MAYLRLDPKDVRTGCVETLGGLSARAYCLRVYESVFLTRFARAPLIGVLLFPCIWASLAFGTADSGALLWEKSEADAVAGWERLRQAVKSVSGRQTYTFEVKPIEGTEPPRKPEFCKEVREFAIMGERTKKVLIDEYSVSGKWMRRRVYAINPDYAFALSQVAQGGPYLVSIFGRDQATVDKVNLWILGHTYSFEESFPRTLSELVKSKDFHFVSCQEVDRGGHKFVELGCTFPPIGLIAKQDPSVRQAAFVFDPSFDWRVVHSTTDRPLVRDEEEMTYIPNSNDEHSSSMASLVMHSTFKTAKARYVSNFESLSYSTLPVSEFYLASFGVAEVPSPNAQRYWRLLTIGLSLIVIGVLLYFAYRRRAQADAAKPRS
jgi:hypothetical protein